MYRKLFDEKGKLTCIQTTDGTKSIPLAEGNSDYREYLKWVSKGNVAEEKHPPPVPAHVLMKAEIGSAESQLDMIHEFGMDAWKSHIDEIKLKFSK